MIFRSALFYWVENGVQINRCGLDVGKMMMDKIIGCSSGFAYASNAAGKIILSIIILSSSAVGAPRLHCEQPRHDFGNVVGRDEIVHEFILTNRGDEPVVVSGIENCCGVESSVEPMTILPGSNAVCRSVFTTSNRYGEQDKQILIASNDRRNPYTDLRLTGKLLKPVEVEPRLVRLGDLLPDSRIDQIITATNLLADAVELESVSCSVHGISAKIVERGERSWIIRLSGSGNLPSGKINGRIQLGFSCGAVDVPMIGTVKPVIQVVPDSILLSGDSTNAVERLVLLRSDDGRPFEVVAARLAGAEGTASLEKLDAGRWRCRVSVVPASVRASAFLVLETDGVQAGSIRVPLMHGSD